MFRRSSLGAFVTMPECRVRALTACDGQRRAALDELHGDPASCVRHVGIRQGKTLLPATAAGHPQAAHKIKDAHPYLVREAHGRLRSYKRAYISARRISLCAIWVRGPRKPPVAPHAWFTYEAVDNIYCGGETPAVESANKGCASLLSPGGGIMPGHLLWAIRIDPGEGGSVRTAKGALGSGNRPRAAQTGQRNGRRKGRRKRNNG